MPLIEDHIMDPGVCRNVSATANQLNSPEVVRHLPGDMSLQTLVYNAHTPVRAIVCVCQSWTTLTRSLRAHMRS